MVNTQCSILQYIIYIQIITVYTLCRVCEGMRKKSLWFLKVTHYAYSHGSVLTAYIKKNNHLLNLWVKVYFKSVIHFWVFVYIPSSAWESCDIYLLGEMVCLFAFWMSSVVLLLPLKACQWWYRWLEAVVLVILWW